MTTFQEYVLIANIILSITIAWVSLRYSKLPSARCVASLSLVVWLWNLVYLLYSWQLFRFPKLYLISIVYLCSSVATTILLIFALTYSNHEKWINRYTLLLLGIQPFITQVLFWVAPLRKIFFFEGGLYYALQLLPLTGFWADVHAMYLYSLEFTSFLLFADIFSKKPRALFWQSGTLLAGSLVPLFFRFRNIISVMPADLFDYTLVGYSMTIVGLAYGIYRQSLVETRPLTNDAVIEGMSDGWMVLDPDNNIIDINPAAEKIVGMSRQNLYGQPVWSVLPDWIDISNASKEGKELEMRRSIRTHDNWRYLNIRLSYLRNREGESFGQLVVWRDITERRHAEDARQRARDEMFVLLNSISNAASHTMSLDDFLSESIYQIISPFDSQIVTVFLLEDEIHGELPGLRLAAHYGLSTESAERYKNVPVEGAFLEDIFKTKQPLSFNNAWTDTRIPNHLKLNEVLSVAILPLDTQTGSDGKVLGVLVLGRKEIKPYSQDEIIRLSAIADQIATLIDSDRRRQLAIASSERERLMRDLHDSVSQKLYGLVTLTEAAQAGLEAGSKVVPTQILTKIGENARQAVKEMRLVLYQMQPIDLEQDGLVTVLHHRLAAVEGRADIQARLLADDDIYLTREKEVALYYIAQEALNNVLKHAHAHSVLVTLKQTRQNVILEIVDDGRGFDVKNVERGGMGLQNMRVRTARVNGKLKIVSQPGSGTKVQVKMNRERLPIQARNR